jgi:hypothetical protein
MHEYMGYLLTILYRNINTCLKTFARTSQPFLIPLKKRDRELFMTVLKMYHQQKDMFKEKIHVCSGRIATTACTPDRTW